MNFNELIVTRQSCRKYDATKNVEKEKLDAILESACLAPSARNRQPYHITVCTGESAKKVATATQNMERNLFTTDAPVMIVISEEPYIKDHAQSTELKRNKYCSIDIGILSAYITAQATELGLGTCILGWFDDDKIRKICKLENHVRLVISLGYAAEDDPLREKKRKSLDELVSYAEEND